MSMSHSRAPSKALLVEAEPPPLVYSLCRRGRPCPRTCKASGAPKRLDLRKIMILMWNFYPTKEKAQLFLLCIVSHVDEVGEEPIDISLVDYIVLVGGIIFIPVSMLKVGKSITRKSGPRSFRGTGYTGSSTKRSLENRYVRVVVCEQVNFNSDQNQNSPAHTREYWHHPALLVCTGHKTPSSTSLCGL